MQNRVESRALVARRDASPLHRGATEYDVGDAGEGVSRARRPGRAPIRRGNVVLFIVFVVLPTLAMFVYGLKTPSPIYQTEVAFALRAHSDQPQPSGLGGIAASIGLNFGGSNDLSAIRSHLLSIATFEQLEEATDLVEHVSSPERDMLMRLSSRATIDEKLDYFRSLIDVDLLLTEQIVTLRTRAFDPRFAREMAAVLLSISEDFVNNLNKRAEQDFLSFATDNVAAARKDLDDARLELEKWRKENEEVDPRQFESTRLGGIAQLSTELANVRAALIRLDASSVGGPRKRELEMRETALVEQIDRERQDLAGESSLIADRISEYERLTLKQEMARELYETASKTLVVAQQDAQRQKKYIVVTAPPAPTESPVFPRPLYHAAMVFIIGLVAFLMLKFLIALTRDYREVVSG